MEAEADQWQGALAPYTALLGEFVRGDIHADDLEARYLTLYLGDDTRWPDAPFHVLDGFFYDVDAYVPEARLLVVRDAIDGDELRRRAAHALERLAELVAPRDG